LQVVPYRESVLPVFVIIKAGADRVVSKYLFAFEQAAADADSP
jgi:hypothetical protein